MTAADTRTIETRKVNVADRNNHPAGRLPVEPCPALRQLDRLIGRWQVTGSLLEGHMIFE
jgi:hypothetical protein